VPFTWVQVTVVVTMVPSTVSFETTTYWVELYVVFGFLALL